MENQNPNPDASAEVKGMTKADAAKRVKRSVTTMVETGRNDKDGNAILKAKVDKLPVSADEVLDFKDYGSHVVVVTVDGQKLSSAKSED